ncbi:MAG: trypsin-like peptidase domain-containing protein [Bacteroidetes bacterium]|nr:trypsin-like peptidase domain-containing protein [Bacteroidota bacterium]
MKYCVVLILLLTSLHAQDDVSTSRQNAITRAVRKAVPAVVGINVVSIQQYTYGSPFFNDDFFSQFFPKQKFYDKVKGLGSGFLISKDGYVLTNEHVVNGAIEIVVTMNDGSKYPAKIVGMDRTTDIALLQIQSDKQLPYLDMGDSDDLIIGEWAIAVGNPFGLFDINNQPTVTVGVISATQRDFGLVDGTHAYQGMIQTDAAINGGNSGGPLLNARGQVIGINTFIYSGSTTAKTSIGIGFAIPINRVRKILAELKETGTVNRTFTMGFKYQAVDRMIAGYLRLKEVRGIVVSEIDKNGTAEKAGLQISDVILSINGKEVNNEYDFRRVMLGDDFRVGDTVELEVIRENKKFKTRLTLSQA